MEGRKPFTFSSSALFQSTEKSSLPSHFLLKNPDKFMSTLMQHPDWHSIEMAKILDAMDPLKDTASLFNMGDVIPFAGHSLGPVFQPAVDNIVQEFAIQRDELHKGHFTNYPQREKVSGPWFDRDRHPASLQAIKQLWGFEDDREFTFTANGLSQNFSLLVDTFYRPGKKGWESGKTKIVMLETEFFSDQASIVSVLKRGIQTAHDWEFFNDDNCPDPESLIIKIKPDAKGLYSTEDIIHTILTYAEQIQLICLSDVVFGTGQRLELPRIFSVLQSTIAQHHLIVGLDLAHSVGNRTIDLKSLPVTFAVGCGYKHLSGPPGSALGLYVNIQADLEKFPPLQGWKAAQSDKVFPLINQYDASIMEQGGAVAFRTSNPPPIALMPVQSYLTYFNEIGFDHCFNKSECLTRYLIAQLKYHLNDKIELITPEDPAQRGAMIVFRVMGITDIALIEACLKGEVESHLGRYEIDSRPPNNIRITPHYAYNKFQQISQMVQKLSLIIDYMLTNQMVQRCVN